VGFYAQNRYFSAALNVGAAVVALPLGASRDPETAAEEPGAAPVGGPGRASCLGPPRRGGAGGAALWRPAV
ncbi:hypothetical protein, partial [Hymenobacter coccineus]|uniref:hypothetical protein n=1 Tax=Hymenobacter coccineus TaxID=1908235 RepID=UPI001955E5EF